MPRTDEARSILLGTGIFRGVSSPCGAGMFLAEGAGVRSERRSAWALMIPGDGDQLDQLLINLIRNGVDAAIETGAASR